jgi:hypothetical protein
MEYISRITDKELQRKLNATGAILICGCKACGKIESASQFGMHPSKHFFLVPYFICIFDRFFNLQ